ncbi:MAG: dipeptide ABC transporter ATP-binding protein [Candidatus Caldatribacterium sp.]|uniref:ABC transporter ATP-binding protein n=1 Tax=Candidatus Caldatribacterium sp. TaxID=2282143 RepID=UPI00299BBFD9|nr:dipeptide ABC transporter ATP-binding protein [Candidatus Caldatribacterium sp.]MCX7731311.1 dipeptide ABC transporter ATP-binding protein [Candidatus Caldatribacterium sp.]MDW8080530.1 dipeptide ABC transporter ATP-binding protein [Candidatus Calescibacterium sp.]
MLPIHTPSGEHDNRYLLEVKDLKKYFPLTRGFWRKTVGYVSAVDGVSFSIKEGETLGLVGESGCGKTTLGRCILRLIEPTAGEVWFTNREGKRIEITTIHPEDLKSVRKEMRMIFQDPFSSLNPRLTVMEIVGEPMRIHGIARGKELEDRVRVLLEMVGLKAQHMRRYPYEFSGGQRQRICIARALASNPRFIIADEPVSALDVSVQAQILNLLEDLKEQLHLTYLFISHDLSVVHHVSDRVAVMYLGKLVELGDTESVYFSPRHPYTEALLSAVPRVNPKRKMHRILLKGDVPSPLRVPSGCAFHPRCQYAEAICAQEEPVLQEVDQDHYVACHFARELTLKGVEADVCG